MAIPIAFHHAITRRHKWTKEGYIYFVELQDDKKPIKIGFTCDLGKRWKNNGSTDCPYELRYISTFRGFVQHECILHSLLKENNMRGEWFSPEPTVLHYANCLNGLDLIEETLRLSEMFSNVKKPKLTLREAIKPFKRMNHLI